LFVGYTHFVSDIGTTRNRPKDWPNWIEQLNYSGLKLQVLGSVIAVSTISILKLVVEISDRSPEALVRSTRRGSHGSPVSTACSWSPRSAWRLSTS
jgi:uncharacterized membrane protein YqhA